jgi:ribosome-associated protein
MGTAMVRIPVIPDSEIEFSFVRSSGPGGQNVNKVSSKAVLRWSFADSRAMAELDAGDRTWLAGRLPLTAAGEIVISSDRHRDQAGNKQDCLDRFRELLRSAAHRPKARKKTKPSRTSRKKRLEGKKRHSEKKASRSFKARM